MPSMADGTETTVVRNFYRLPWLQLAHRRCSATGAGVSGSGTTSLTITGSLSQVNSDLGTLADSDPSRSYGIAMIVLAFLGLIGLGATIVLPAAEPAPAADTPAPVAEHRL